MNNSCGTTVGLLTSCRTNCFQEVGGGGENPTPGMSKKARGPGVSPASKGITQGFQ